MKQGLLKDTLVYGLSAVISRGLSFIVLPIYTRILSPGDYGALDMITTVGSLANMIIALEITQGLARHLGDVGDAGERKRMSSTALLFTLGAYGLALAVAMTLSPWINSWLLGDPRLFGALQIGLVVIASNGCFYLLQSQLRYEMRSMAFAKVSLLYAVLVTVSGVLLGFVAGLKLQGILLSQLLAAAAASLAALWYLRGAYGLTFDVGILGALLRFSMPLVPSGLATFLTLYANRLILNALESLGDVGFFGVAARVAGITILLIVGLQSSLTPWIYANYRAAETPARLGKVFEWFVAAALLTCLALGIFARELMTLVVAPQFLPAATLVLPIAFATLLGQMYIFFPGVAIAKRTDRQLAIFAVTALASVGLNWLLISRWGVAGAAAATLLSSMLFFALWCVVSQRYYAVPVRWRNIGFATVLFAVAAGLPSVLTNVGDAAAAFGIKAAIIVLFGGGLFAIGLISWHDLRQAAESFPRWQSRRG